MLNNKTNPRVNEEVQRILHLLDLAKIGDWYLYQNHIEIRVYGVSYLLTSCPSIYLSGYSLWNISDR
jgi:hypothetical protein